MNFLRSYGGLTTLGWLSALVFVASITDASLTDSELAARLAYGLAAVTAVIVIVLFIVLRKMKQRAEDKVTASEPILLADIQVLAKSNSRLLEDAIALHVAQKDEAS
jgi:hypothetical protein